MASVLLFIYITSHRPLSTNKKRLSYDNSACSKNRKEGLGRRSRALILLLNLWVISKCFHLWALKRFDTVIQELLIIDGTIRVRVFNDQFYTKYVLGRHNTDVARHGPTTVFFQRSYLWCDTPFFVVDTFEWVLGPLRLNLQFFSLPFLATGWYCRIILPFVSLLRTRSSRAHLALLFLHPHYFYY